MEGFVLFDSGHEGPKVLLRMRKGLGTLEGKLKV